MSLMHCPDCGKKLEINDICNCGWKSEETEEINNNDYQCQFQNETDRCDKRASHAIRFAKNNWFCFEHWYAQVNKHNK